MALYKAILNYDGTNFAGSQKQVNKRTVQSELEAALRNLGWDGKTLPSAGRTDKGVHATGQVVAFELSWAHSIPKLLFALNAYLPEDIAIERIELAKPNFHPRYDALARRYQYNIYCSPLRNALKDRYAWRVWPAVDPELLFLAAKPLTGIHDFRLFGAPPKTDGVTIRHVFHAAWLAKSATEYTFEIEANAFLYHMVRRIVRLQIDIAQKRVPIEHITLCLAGKIPAPVKGIAPPQGLTLLSVRYPEQK